MGQASDTVGRLFDDETFPPRREDPPPLSQGAPGDPPWGALEALIVATTRLFDELSLTLKTQRED